MSNRDADLEQLRQDYYHTSDPNVRRVINETARKIVNESGRTRSMRESLIKAHKSGNQNEIKNIHEDVKKHYY